MPRATIVILSYNQAAYLPSAIENALAQDFPAVEREILVIDDGSTDGSEAAVKPYLGRVRWLTKKNGGQISAFNHGFEAAQGEFLAILEADDAWDPSKLRRCVERLEAEPEAAAVQHWLRQVRPDGEALPGYDYPASPDRWTFGDVIWGRIPVAGTSALVCRRSKIKAFMPFPPLLYGADICLRAAAAAGGGLLNIPEVLGKRLIHGSNLFGETFLDDAQKVEKAAAIHEGLVGFYRKVMTARSITPDEAFFRRMEIDRRQIDLFRARYAGNIAGALGAWTRAVSACGLRVYALFKGATLLLAVVSPALYVRAHRLYARKSF